MTKHIDKRNMFLVIITASILYFLISAVNHILLRTAALDLGLYTNALYDYAHFSFNDSTTFKENPANLLSDHFDLLLLLVSPFSWIFREWTLLILQIIALLAGGIGIHTYFREKFPQHAIAKPAMVFFYIHFAVLAALSFDFHSNVVAASMLPWLFVFLQRSDTLKAWLILFLVLICKENMGLWMIFVCAGAAWIYRKEGKATQLKTMAVVSLVYFLLVTLLIMPALDPSNSFVQFRYAVLGTDYKQALITIFSEPIKVAKALFLNQSGNPQGDGIKSEFWLFFIFSGGLLLIFRPVWLIMLTPIFFQKLLLDNYQTWGVNDHYSIEIAPVLALGLFDIAGKLVEKRRRVILSTFLLLMTLATSIRLMDRTSARVSKTNIRLYQAAHWKKPASFHEIQKAISLIPADASVCAQSNILPQIAWRDKAYMFPLTSDAEYIIYSYSLHSYPMEQSEFKIKCAQLESDDLLWETVFSEKDVRVLKRRKD